MKHGSLYPEPKTEMDMGPIRDALGDDMPHVTPDPVGRLRLITALRGKYGPSYRNHPVAAKAITHFDGEQQYFAMLRKIKKGT